MDPMVDLAQRLSARADEGVQHEELEESFESMTVDQLDEFIKNGGEGSFIGTLALEERAWEEKVAAADRKGREMAKLAAAVKLPTVAGLKSGVQKAVGQGLHSVMGSGAATRVGAGVAGGAGLGAARGLVGDPGKDANGNQKSRLGFMAKNMVGGAALGAAAGAAADPLARAAARNTGRVGQATRGAMQAGAATKRDLMRTRGFNMAAAKKVAPPVPAAAPVNLVAPAAAPTTVPRMPGARVPM
jgi:hypothetical protein